MNHYRLQTGQRVLINLRSGDGLVGVVREVNRGAVFLGEPHMFRGPRGEKDRLDGEVIVPADNIAWLQVV